MARTSTLLICRKCWHADQPFSAGTHRSQCPPTRAFASPADVKQILGGITRSSALTVVDMTAPVGWAAISGAAEGSELFWDSIQWLFVSSYTLSRNVGRALIPVAADKAFTVVGIDASTGLQMYSKVYGRVTAGDPLGAVVLDATSDNDTSPIPTFASPA